eukprot:4164044-Prymnesium_polylepis.2
MDTGAEHEGVRWVIALRGERRAEGAGGVCGQAKGQERRTHHAAIALHGGGARNDEEDGLQHIVSARCA